MRRALFFAPVGFFAFITGVAINSLTHRPTRPPDTRSFPIITKIAIEPNAPLSVGPFTKATGKVLQLELTNVSDKGIRSFNYTNYKQCDTRWQPEGGGVWFTDPHVIKPGEKYIFDVGSDEFIIRGDRIEECLQNPTEIRFQLVDVRFVDGSTWKAVPGDFPGIKSSEP